MNKWFVQTDNSVKGPFSAEDVQSRVSKGELRPSDLIWGPALEEWRPVHWWLANYNSILANLNQRTPIEEWHYSINGQTHGPVSRLELIHELKKLKTPGETLLWTAGMVSWAPVYELAEILTEVGVSRRAHPRAEILGKATFKLENQSPFDADMVVISEGGFAVALNEGIKPGSVVAVEIHAPALREVLHAKAECRYCSNGLTGFRFTHLGVEYKSNVIQYVKSYISQSTPLPTAAEPKAA